MKLTTHLYLVQNLERAEIKFQSLIRL